MADRAFHAPVTQGVKHVHIPFRVTASDPATDPPTFVEGDKVGASAGSYIVCTKVATGKYRFKTVDKYIGLVKADVQLSFAAPDGTIVHAVKTPTQNSDKTWQFEVWVFEFTETDVEGDSQYSWELADLSAGDEIAVDLVLRDSQVAP